MADQDLASNGSRWDHASIPRYQYGSIPVYPDVPEPVVRLLVISAGDPEDEIAVSFVAENLNNISTEHQKYRWESVSYAWRGQKPSKRLVVGGLHLEITENVSRILRDLRQVKLDRVVWIDAVCINQEDVKEKAGQISLMRDIYGKAEGVIIWLSPERQPSMNNLAKAQLLLARDPREDLADSGVALDQYLQLQYPKIIWDSPFHRIAKCAWFQRIWTVQEVVVGRNVKVYIGGQMFTWDFISEATLRFLSGLPADLALNKSLDDCCTAGLLKNYNEDTHMGLSMMRLVNRLRGSIKDQAHPLMPSEVVHLCRNRKAFLPHDMVYGVSGLFQIYQNPLGMPTPLRIDYKVHFFDAYRQFTLWCLEVEGNMDVIAQLRNEGGDSPWRFAIGSLSTTKDFTGPPKHEWSSWIGAWNSNHSRQADFRTSPDIHLEAQRDHVNAHIPSNVTMFRTHEVAEEAHILPRYQHVKDILVVRGFILDVFTPMYKVLNDVSNKDSTKFATLWSKIIPKNSQSNLVLFGDPKPSPEMMEQKLSRTMELEPKCSHLWRDGKLPTPPRQGISGDWKVPFLTRRTCLAITYPYMNVDKGPVVCAIYGARALFVLQPAGTVPGNPGKTRYTLVSGDCFIDGFEDGKGIEMGRKLGLQEEDIYIA